MKLSCGHYVYTPRQAYTYPDYPRQAACPMCVDGGVPSVKLSCEFCGAPVPAVRDAAAAWKQEENGYWHKALACAACAAQEHEEPGMSGGNNPPLLVAIHVPRETAVRIFAELQWLGNITTPEPFAEALAKKTVLLEYYSPREYKYYAHADFGLFRLFPSHIEIEGMVYGTASGRLLWWLPEPDSHYCNNTYFEWVLSSYPPARVLRSNAPGVEWTFNPCSMRAGVGYFVADIGRESIIFREELIDKLLTLGVQNVIEADSPLGDRLWWAYQRDIDWVEREFEPLPEDDD